MRHETYVRNCDFCGIKYNMNLTEIPRINIIKRIELDDLTYKDSIASPDYCDVCIEYIIRWLGKKQPLKFNVNPFYTSPCPTVDLPNRI